MCAEYIEMMSYSNKKKKGNNLGEQTLNICRRLLFELYSRYPESMTFRDCEDLNFKAYTDVVENPIALNVISERLHPDRDDQVSVNSSWFFV